MVSPREEKGKKRRRGGAGEDGHGIDGLEGGDEGRVQGLKIRLTRKGDAFSISKLDKGVAEDEGIDEAHNGNVGEREGGLSNAGATPSRGVQIDLSNSLKSQDGGVERRTGETPSRKRKHAGKNGVPESLLDSGGRGGKDGGSQAVAVPGVNKATTPGELETYSDRNSQQGGSAGEQAQQVLLSAGTQPAKASNPSGLGSSVAVKTTDNAAQRLPPNKDLYRIPSYAGWFVWGKIHPLERRALSEFFDQKTVSKTPKIYKEYRDFMINKYRENKQRRLTFTEVRRLLIGDVNSLRRVFDFLEHWGLINYHILQDSATVPPAGTAAPSPTLVESVPSGIRVVTTPARLPAPAAVASSPIQPLVSSSPRLLDMSGRSSASNLVTHKNVFSPTSKSTGPDPTGGPDKPDIESRCHSCRGDCSKQRYHLEQAGVDLCPDCFKTGKFPPGATAKEFVRIDAEPTSLNQWTSKETLSLLEAIMRYGDNWNQVAHHVATKSKSECVKHFIQLPFGDRLVGEPGGEDPQPTNVDRKVQDKVKGMAPVVGEVQPTNAGEATNGEVAARGTPPTATGSTVGHDFLTPFADTSHPLLSQVAFLSATVGARVAAATAQAAVVAIAEEDPAALQLAIEQTQSLHSAGLKDISQPTTTDHTDSSKEATLSAQCPPEEELSQAEKPGTQEPMEGPNTQAENTAKLATDTLPSAVQTRAAVATAFGVAAANAKLLADQEEREIEHLVASIIDTQMKKLYTKMEHFEELERLLEKERLEVEHVRQQVYADRIRYAAALAANSKLAAHNSALD